MKKLLLLLCLFYCYTPATYSQHSNGYQTIQFDSASFAAIAASFNGASIVGLGESSHGSKEMTVFRTEFIQYLMQHTDYKVLVMEDHFSTCAQLNHYLSTGEGDFEALYLNLYGVWRMPAFKALLLWMRNYNANRPMEKDKVFFYGADMQGAHALPLLRAYVSNYKTEVSNLPEVDFEFLEQLNSKNFDLKQQPKAVLKKFEHNLGLLSASLQAITQSNSALAETAEHKFMRKHMEILAQHYENETASVLKWITYRDKKMADNVGWLREQTQPGNNKLLVWAHSGHLNNVNLRMGSYLKKSHPDYFVLGQDFISGETNGIYQKRPFTYNLQEDPRLLANYFIEKPGKTFFIDFQHQDFKTSDLYKYLRKHPLLHNEGHIKNNHRIKAGKQFDALIIHRTSSAKW